MNDQPSRTIEVPLHGDRAAGRHVILDQADWKQLQRRGGSGMTLHVVGHPPCEAVVVVRRPGKAADGYSELASRMILKTGTGRTAIVLNEDPLDLRRENLTERRAGLYFEPWMTEDDFEIPHHATEELHDAR